MAKLSVIKRQIRREKLVSRYSELRQKLKTELKEANSFKAKMEVHVKLQKLPRDSSPTRLRNRCWKTGRGKAVFRDFGLCRHMVRDMANQGLLPGVIKSSW
uniref:ribosomal protein S14 n=1 Tax=Eustigmatophyceae sp. WTwin 8/9 T-6m6.8 TaxID=2974615 RepID=UPI0021825848|nr:ribosomal protein S14 [Eustigmatophyceae sp. WTwin 8/9 T-6m6.8]UVI61045.1 ribosomal protein S14 [Eustigmatophyceae sp. WTwin 8/9 T-6m6.8]